MHPQPDRTGVGGADSCWRASLLVFRTFRERYLLIWIVGWLAYLVSRWTMRGCASLRAEISTAISQAEFVLALGLFSAAILVYTHARKLLLPLLAVDSCAFWLSLWPRAFSGRTRSSCGSDSEVAYRVIALAAAIQLIRYRWARWEIGPWMLAAEHAADASAMGADCDAICR